MLGLVFFSLILVMIGMGRLRTPTLSLSILCIMLAIVSLGGIGLAQFVLADQIDGHLPESSSYSMYLTPFYHGLLVCLLPPAFCMVGVLVRRIARSNCRD